MDTGENERKRLWDKYLSELRMRPQPGCVRAVLIAAGGVSYAGDLPSDSEQYSSS